MGFTSILDGPNELDGLWLSCQSVVTLLTHTDMGRMTLAPRLTIHCLRPGASSEMSQICESCEVCKESLISSLRIYHL